MPEETKSFTKAQIRYLIELNSVVIAARQNLDGFIVYLRDEFEAPAPEWKLENIEIGFTRSKPQVGE